MDHRLPRFFVADSAFDLTSGQVELEDSNLRHQLETVLRLKPQAQVILLDNLGNSYLCLWQENSQGKTRKQSRSLCSFKILQERREDLNAGATKSTVYLPLIKLQRFEWALEKITELQATRVVPVEYQRSQVKAENINESKMLRWHQLLKEASEQSERERLPALEKAQKFKCIVQELKNNKMEKLILVLKERSQAESLGALLYNRKNDSHLPLHIFLGPEGGLTEDESEALEHLGAIAVSLGNKILRSETAALAALSVVSCLWR
jgi:16S rRNA (uracil1498-N3)-methyltransferase